MAFEMIIVFPLTDKVGLAMVLPPIVNEEHVASCIFELLY